MIKKLPNFLSSVYFALFLILATAVFVIFGTILEAVTDSHFFAARLTYHHPFFRILLSLYFLNILLAACKRYPFRTRHIPFLAAHLGLLMILSGVFIKSLFGIQGSMTLLEGSTSSRVILPNSFALNIESKRQAFQLDLRQTDLGRTFKIGDLSVTLLHWSPHCEESLQGFIKNEYCQIINHSPIPLSCKESMQGYKTHDYTIYAINDADFNEWDFPGYASLFFLKDAEKKEKLVAFNEYGKRFETQIGQSFYVYDKGFKGYGVFVELPEDFHKIELEAPLTKVFYQTKSHKKIEELKPQISLLISNSSHNEIVDLGFDRNLNNLKWPVMKGSYLLRFQPSATLLPFALRLKQARQIFYPDTQKPYSYESNLVIDGQPVTLSMNHVFEKKGYRFYMAGLLEPEEGAKRVHLAVNYDPAKKYLTYPGAIILAVGILLLYLRKYYA